MKCGFLCVAGALLSLVCLSGLQAQEVSKPAETTSTADPNAVRENIETSIQEWIRLIEAKEYEALIKSYVEPEELSKLTSMAGLNFIVTIYTQQRKDAHLKILKELEKQTPQLSDDKLTATYEVKPPIQGVSQITFKKIDKYWYGSVDPK